MKQTLLSFLLVLLPLLASAEAVEIDGIYYNLISKVKTAEVTVHPNKYSGDIIIPQTIEYDGVNYEVTVIGKNAFYLCNITSISIPESVTVIDDKAFDFCGLKAINLPPKLTTIGGMAFEGHQFTSISIPSSVTEIGSSAFYTLNKDNFTSVHIQDINSWLNINFVENGTSNPLCFAHHLFLNGEEVKHLEVPTSVTEIKPFTFYGCTSLESISLNNVTSIGKSAFARSGLKSITIPNSVISINDMAFERCTDLTSVVIPNSVKNIGRAAFYGCSGLTSLSIPNSVTAIAYKAFANCSGLTSITIPNSIETIEEMAFSGCVDLKDVYCYAKSPSTALDAFSDSYVEYATLHVPIGSIEYYKTQKPWSDFKEIVKLDMPKYTLTYIIDNEVYKEYSIEEGETITMEPAPTKEGYTFSGWSEILETMPDHNVVITGTFTVNQYKLTYMVDGAEYKSYEIDYGSTITPEAIPTKEGYTFSGWSWIPSKMPAEDVTVTGTFTVNQYKLTYMVDGVEYKSYEIDYGTTITPETEPTKEGYTFSGWSEIPGTMPAEDVTVTGTFTINQYKLTYMIDDKVYKEVEYDYGATIVPEQRPDDEEYISFEWVGLPETMPAHDVTVYASYETGIHDILMQQNVVRIYNSNGIVTDRPQKGLNIIQMSDGSTRKVLVK